MTFNITAQIAYEQLGLGLEITPVSVEPHEARPWSVRKAFKAYRPDEVVSWQVLKNILPDEHLVWFVRSFVAKLDLSEITSSYKCSSGRGQPPYDPGMMLTLLIYCYCRGSESSRVIEQATCDDIACRIITEDQHPDHSTIANFRKDHFSYELF